jgi:hypothetical protein
MLSLVLGIVGTTSGLIRAARANTALATANADLTAANTKVQARYNLAVDAIKTFVPHGRQRRLPAEAEPGQGAARPALEVGC